MAKPNVDPAAEDGGGLLSRGLPHLQLASSSLGDLAHSALLLAASGRVLWSTERWGPGGSGAGLPRTGGSSAAAQALGGRGACEIESQSAPGAEGFAELAEPVRAAGDRVLGALVLRTRAAAHRPEHGLLLRQAALGIERELAAWGEREALLERQEELLGLLSHDLRTPLSTLAMQAQLLRRGRDDAAKFQRRIDAILWGGTRLNTMIQELVDLARLESGLMKASVRPVALGPFWADLVDRLSGARDLERIAVRLPPDLPPVLADPDKLERVLVSLLSNALRLSPPTEPVRFDASAGEEAVVLAVRDRGPGIPREEQPRVFDRFYRSPQAEANPEGLGLGLHLAKRLTELQGGTLALESGPGAGSSFQVRLPVA